MHQKPMWEVVARATTRSKGCKRWTDGELARRLDGWMRWRTTGRSAVEGEADRERVESACNCWELNKQVRQGRRLFNEALDKWLRKLKPGWGEIERFLSAAQMDAARRAAEEHIAALTRDVIETLPETPEEEGRSAHYYLCRRQAMNGFGLGVQLAYDVLGVGNRIVGELRRRLQHRIAPVIEALEAVLPGSGPAFVARERIIVCVFDEVTRAHLREHPPQPFHGQLAEAIGPIILTNRNG